MGSLLFLLSFPPRNAPTVSELHSLKAGEAFLAKSNTVESGPNLPQPFPDLNSESRTGLINKLVYTGKSNLCLVTWFFPVPL